jgi:hypothetical protein
MANEGVVMNSAHKVSLWQDQSPSHSNYVEQSTASKQPVWTASIPQLNGYPAILFDGVDDVLSPWSTEGAENYTFFVIAIPQDTIRIDSESTSGTAGMTGQHYVLGSPTAPGADGSVCLSLGSNGASVYGYGTDYLPPLAVYSGAIATSCPVTVIIDSYQPSIYLCGDLVRTTEGVSPCH